MTILPAKRPSSNVEESNEQNQQNVSLGKHITCQHNQHIRPVK